MAWRAEWGPASLLAIAQLVVLMLGGVYTFASLQNTAANTKNTAEALQAIVVRQQEKTSDMNDRLIKVETNMIAQTQTLDRIDQKLDKNAKTVQSPLANDKRPMAQAFKLTENEKSKLQEEMMHYAAFASSVPELS